MKKKVAIIGCGLIGNKRMASLNPDQVSIACDLDLSRAEAMAKRAPSCRATSDASVAATSPEADIVIISTLNASLAPLAKQAICAGKHVLIEKPGAIHSEELEELQKLAKQMNVQVRLGYNHRYHPAILKAHEIFKSGSLGSLMFIRGRYGHGGRVGYDREWRANPALSGGGELIDQGVHLIDLASWFLGDFTSIEGHAETYFWQMPVDDNAFLNLRTKDQKTAFLQVSCTEWKNLFSFEIYGQHAKLHIEGLGGSYGVEKLSYYRMLPEMGPPETTIFEFPRGDNSWKLEMQEFLKDVELMRTPNPGLREGIRHLKVVEEIYRKSNYPRG